MASATGLRDAESIIFNKGRSVASWTFTGRVFHPAQRPEAIRMEAHVKPVEISWKTKHESGLNTA